MRRRGRSTVSIADPHQLRRFRSQEGNAWPRERNRLKLYDARSMTSSQIRINTPIVIAAAARFSPARAALGQSDRSATSSYGDLLAAQGMSPESLTWEPPNLI